MVNHKHDYISESIIEEKLLAFQDNVHPLWGIQKDEERKYFAALIFDAHKELRAISKLSDTICSKQFQQTPISENFDPIATAIQYYHEGYIDEACWLLFLVAYIGKHPKREWDLLYCIYGPEDKYNWNWERVSERTADFKRWLIDNEPWLKLNGGLGNVHKFSVFDYNKAVVTGIDIEHYVHWVKSKSNHLELFYNASDASQGHCENTYEYLYTSLTEQTSFNKLITFNYLALIGNVKIVNAAPNHLYLNEILLHKQAIKSLINGNRKIKVAVTEMNDIMVNLANSLELPKCIQVLQKALINRFREKSIVNRQNFRRANKVLQREN